MAMGAVLARNVRRIRADQGLSLAQLARLAGLSKQTVVTIETGAGNPTVDTVDALAVALSTSTRALLTETGSEILVHAADDTAWLEQGALSVRQLDQAFGSGYVFNVVLRLQRSSGIGRSRARTRGALRHCYVLSGRVRMGPESSAVTVDTGDFVRFPADTAHVFESLTLTAEVFVCTTAPQLSMSGGDRVF